MSHDRTMSLPPEAQALKVASKALIHAAGGGLACAVMLETRQQRMSDCGRPNTPDFLRINEVAALEDITHGQPGHPIVTRLLARRQGYTLLPMPEAPPAGADLIRLVAALAKENGDVANAVLTSIADHKIDPAEQAHIIEQIDEQIDVALRMRATVVAVGGSER